MNAENSSPSVATPPPLEGRRKLALGMRRPRGTLGVVQSFSSPLSNDRSLLPVATPRSIEGVRPTKKICFFPPCEPPKDVREFWPKDRMLAISDANKDQHEQDIIQLLTMPFQVPIQGYISQGPPPSLGMRRRNCRIALHDPYAENALVLYKPPELTKEEQMKLSPDEKLVHVVVDPILTAVLRPHQREGVQFMYECVEGKRVEGFQGCIMADEMGLGKTLQCITLLFTLLRQSPEGKPGISKVIIVCPSSLVKNWDKEIQKWLGSRVSALPVDSSGKENMKMAIECYMADVRVRAATSVLIISYETFRIHSEKLNSSPIGLVICDEGHRLKNSDNQTYRALAGLQCPRRVLISGTPIQNDLLEYYSLVNFVNPGMLGTAAEFRRRFETTILRGRDADASDVQRTLGDERLAEMAALVNRCIIRRTSALLTKYLPVKYELIVCCRLTELQTTIYKKMIERERGNAEGSTSLAFINLLKKLCNHPQLVYEDCAKPDSKYSQFSSLFPQSVADSLKRINASLSGKMIVLDYLLAVTRKTTNDKWVLISNYTQTIDAFVELCRLRNYGYVRLDGSNTIKQRAKTVEKFNDPNNDSYVFLLSSKAGGCGLNLIGANRLIMFDPDWNPANDDQAMARVWRDGQKKVCYVYRLLATGSIEEKIFQRQTHKKALSSCVVDEVDDVARHFSVDELRHLFKLEGTTTSDTHDKIRCKRCMDGHEMADPPGTADTNSDLQDWFHSARTAHKVADPVLRQLMATGPANSPISFVFHQKSHDKVVEPKKKKTEEEEDPDFDEANADGGDESD